MSGACGGGFSTMLLPAAIAGAILCAARLNGALNGVIAATTPDRKAQQHGELAGSHRTAVERYVTTLDADRFLCGQQHGLQRAADLRVGVLDRLAGFTRQQLGETCHVALDERCDSAQQRGALVGRNRRGLLASIRCSANRNIDFGG